MNRIKVSLKKDIIVREEGDYFYLFNKDNSSVLKVPVSVFNELRKKSVPGTTEFKKVVDVLHEYGMTRLKEDLSESSVDKCGEKKLGKGTFSNIYGLRSSLNPFAVLWAITPHCNLRCVYCFPNVNSAEAQASLSPLTSDNIYNIANQIIQAKVFQVTISGGEALSYKNLWNVISMLNKENIKVLVITNGTTINNNNISNLLKYEIIVGVSLDGPNEEINSKTRGIGVFDRTINGIKKLKRAGVPVGVLVTLTRYNFPVLYEHIKFVNSLGIFNIIIQDLRPFGTVIDYDNLRLTVFQEEELYDTIVKIKKNFPEIYINLSELFFFPGHKYKEKKCGKIMQCPAGDNLAYIDFRGDIYPCTSLPTMKLGNLLTEGDITSLWRSSEMIKRLRALKEKSILDIPGCMKCSLNEYCEGGCRGDALFYNGDLYGYPSRCPVVMK